MIYEVYTQWFSEQPKEVREACSRIVTENPIWFNGKKFKAIKAK